MRSVRMPQLAPGPHQRVMVPPLAQPEVASVLRRASKLACLIGNPNRPFLDLLANCFVVRMSRGTTTVDTP